MAGDTQKEISKKLDQKVRQMELGEVLGKMIRTTKQFGDKIQKKDPVKRTFNSTGGRASLKIGGPGQQTRRKKEDIEDKVGDATVKNLFAKKKMKALLGKKDKKNYKEDFKEFGDSRREVFATQKMAKGGRAGYKSGTRGCKLAMKGKGRAYGKNS